MFKWLLKKTGDYLTADEANQSIGQLSDTIERSGVRFRNRYETGDLNEHTLAIRRYSLASDYFEASGVRNQYTLQSVTPFIRIDAYFHGMRVRFKVNENNTGATTVNIDSRGIVPVTQVDGSPLNEDDFIVGRSVQLRYNANVVPERFELEFRSGYAGGVVGQRLLCFGGYKADFDVYRMELGRSLNQADYPELFALYGFTYGRGSDNGATTFSEPDSRNTTHAGISLSSLNTIAKKDMNNAAMPMDKKEGDFTGEISHIMTADELVKHRHDLPGGNPGGYATGSGSKNPLDLTTRGESTSYSGEGKAFNVMQPTEFVPFFYNSGIFQSKK